MSFIETDHLLFRTWMDADAEPARAALYGDPAVMRYLGSRGEPLDPEATRALIAAMSEANEKNGFGVWPVLEKDGGGIIGACGLQPLPNTGRIELVYAFARAYWGRGFAFEAASAILTYGFDVMRLPEIVAVVRPMNARSIRLVNRLGMRFERVVRAYKHDLLLYAVSRAR